MVQTSSISMPSFVGCTSNTGARRENSMSNFLFICLFLCLWRHTCSPATVDRSYNDKQYRRLLKISTVFSQIMVLKFLMQILCRQVHPFRSGCTNLG